MLLFFALATAIFVFFEIAGFRPARNTLACGLFGYSGKNPADLTKLRWLATLNQSRGGHSTGVFGVKGNKTQEKILYKNNVSATDFVKDKDAIEAMRAVMTLLGHTRLATQGAQTKDNAHPFSFDLGEKVVGAHNGFVVAPLQPRYLREFKLTDKDLPLNSQGLPEVDSMLIISALSKMKGDYNILPQIEGGINLLFMLPDKYENVLFAYKRPARPLSYGISQEGIYISSEQDPLSLIGCTKVMELEDHTLSLFRDGEVLDIISLPKPKIHVPLNATRTSLTLSQTEREAYEELRTTGTGTNRQSDLPFEGPAKYTQVRPKHRSWPAKKTNVVEEDHYDDRKKLIVQDIIEEVDLLAPSAILQLPVKNSQYIEIDDLLDGLLMINLVDSVKREGLPAWVAMDQDNQLEFNGITGVNGSTVIKYNYVDLRDSGVKRVVQLVSPINPKTCYQFPVEINPGRVVEVTLQLPFPQTQSNKASDTKSDTAEGKGHNRSSKARGFDKTGELFDSTSSPSLLPARISVPETLRKQGKQVHLRREEEEINGKLGEKEGDGKTNSRVATVYPKRSNALTTENIALYDSLKKIKKDDPFFNFGKDQISLRYSQEYTNAYQCFRYFIGDLIDAPRLFADAAILKISEDRKYPYEKFSISHYTITLLNIAMLDYITATKLADMQTICRRILKFVEKWENGEHLYSKLGLIDPITYERLSSNIAIPTIGTINAEISEFHTAELALRTAEKERSEGSGKGK